ncbi:ABC transporter ATP-binding protein [Enterococcus ureasiticus]|uniref:ABC transporter domain-containing protein n=1 Tax=Enterococcus ureasiticus TaxID=903984 RepID=A0A1E5GH41_9ENTE|nr:ATP-binding cassette domain-containing protein [Enterococcus ureasiticus]OEG12053.1 hypothetical protein BCR21_07390 [Enterococcus ureasiticus]
MKNWLVLEQISKTYYKEKLFKSKEKIDGGLKPLSFCVSEEIVGILGESGSGKTTLAKLIAGIEKPDKGSGKVVLKLGELPKEKNPVSMIFQDYVSAINPEFTVEKALLESISGKNKKVESKEKIIAILNKVGLSEELLDKKPRKLSGGQIQRICIARSILTEAKVLIFDEAFSSLDLVNVDRLLELLNNLKKEFNLYYIVVTHNLEVATYFCDKLIFLKEGHLEEVIETSRLMHTKSSYVQALIDAQI